MIVLVYLGWLIVASLFGLEHAYAESNYRSAAFFLLLLAIRYWFFVGVARPVKVWVAVQGVLAAIAAVGGLCLRFLGASVEPLATLAARANSGPTFRFWVNEPAIVITAICCWILYAELKRIPPWKPVASAVS